MILWLRLFNSSSTPLTIAGVNSFDAKPYRPPITLITLPVSASGHNVEGSGSPALPVPLFGRVAIDLTGTGNALTKFSTDNGRKRRTLGARPFAVGIQIFDCFLRHLRA
jgi:hypothetical protein